MRKPISRQSKIVSPRSLIEESDKGCVIIIGSILQETLRQLHEAHIAANTHPKKVKIFEDLTRIHAPLSSFAGLIQIAYAYNLLSYKDFQDLEIIRRLRNEAAHCFWDFSLEDSGVQNLVMQLAAASRRHLDFSIDKKAIGKSDQPKLTKAKRHLILNGLTLLDIIQEKLADAIELYLEKRKSCEQSKTSNLPI